MFRISLLPNWCLASTARGRAGRYHQLAYSCGAVRATSCFKVTWGMHVMSMNSGNNLEQSAMWPNPNRTLSSLIWSCCIRDMIIEYLYLEWAKACWFWVQGPWMTSVSVLKTCEATPIALKKFALPAGSISSWETYYDWLGGAVVSGFDCCT